MAAGFSLIEIRQVSGPLDGTAIWSQTSLQWLQVIARFLLQEASVIFHFIGQPKKTPGLGGG